VQYYIIRVRLIVPCVLCMCQMKTRMPSCFGKEYGLHVDDLFMLRDPNRNMFEVKVHKKNGKVYLRDGWKGLKDFYKVGRGAWVALTYIESNLLDMTITDRSGVEVDYPNKFLPPMSKMIIQSDGGLMMRFYRSFVHILVDITSGYLVSDLLCVRHGVGFPNIGFL